MLKTYHVSSLFGLAALGAAIAGCAKEPAPAPTAVVEEELVEEIEVPAVAPADVNDAMAALSESDRAAALAQKICPVSDEPLGSMGTPLKVTVKGRDVFICCESCRGKLESSPDEYLAKLDAK